MTEGWGVKFESTDDRNNELPTKGERVRDQKLERSRAGKRGTKKKEEYSFLVTSPLRTPKY